MAQGPSDTILVAIRIMLRIRESKVRNPDPPDRRRFVLSEHIISSLITIFIYIMPILIMNSIFTRLIAVVGCREVKGMLGIFFYEFITVVQTNRHIGDSIVCCPCIGYLMNCMQNNLGTVQLVQIYRYRQHISWNSSKFTCPWTHTSSSSKQCLMTYASNALTTNILTYWLIAFSFCLSGFSSEVTSKWSTTSKGESFGITKQIISQVFSQTSNCAEALKVHTQRQTE